VTTLPPLASVTAITDGLPSSVSVEDKRVRTLIADASAAIRRYTGRPFAVQQAIQRIRPIGYRIKLPQRPVISVDDIAIKLPGNDSLVTIPGWYWDGSSEVWLTDGSSIINLSEEIISALLWQTPTCYVTYTFGDEEVPDDVVSVIRTMVSRVITAPNVGGVITESVGEYSYRLSDAAAQGVLAFTQAEKDILDDYRIKKSSTVELRSS
jgi:hypothetical protein